jgi:hypothetical protein
MSGFDVAGIILGSIPLLISGLEHYSKGVSTIKNMKAYESVLEMMIADFTTSSVIYRNSCEELLSPLMLPDVKFYELLNDPKSKAWDSDELGKELRNRLGDSYEPYKSAVEKLNKRIDLLRRKLDLNDDMQVSALIYSLRLSYSHGAPDRHILYHALSV